MSEIERIADQLRRAYAGRSWHGPSLREALAGVTAERAAARPVAGAHSIWELALHAAAWQGVVRRRLEGEEVTEPEEGDWPEVGETDDAAWGRALARLDESHRKLLRTVSSLDDSRLGERVGGVSLYAHLHGVAQHDIYHAGQIALLKKALG